MMHKEAIIDLPVANRVLSPHHGGMIVSHPSLSRIGSTTASRIVELILIAALRQIGLNGLNETLKFINRHVVRRSFE